MKIVGWAADTGACGHYRMIWPWQSLQESGDPGEARWSLEMRGVDLLEADVAVVQRACLPTPVRILELVVGAGGEYWFEVDDDLFHLDPENVLFSEFQTDWRRAGLMHAMDMAKGLTVSTEPLAAQLREYNDNVVVLPNCLPDYFGDTPVHNVLKAEEPGDTVYITWAGSPTHHGDIHEAVRYGVRKAVGRADTAQLVVVGHDYRKAFGLPAAQFSGWSEDIPAFHASLLQYDIGLCPLQRTTFNRSKSGIKAMEYQAAGVVPIAQDCEAYRTVVTDGVDGFLVRTEHEWKDRLELLIHDHELRSKMRDAGKELTQDRLYRNNVHRWLTAYTQ